MAYQSKYTGLQIDDILDSVEWKEGKIEDLEQIRAGAQKGATALQSYTEKYTGTVTGIKINGETKSGNGVIDLGTISTDISGKVDKVAGKQLSTEDFTTALKTKLEGLSNYDDTELSNAISTLRGDFDKLVSGDTTTAIKTFNEVIAFLDGVQDTQDLSSIIASIEQQIAGKQDELISGTNIKTINGESILGEGDLTVEGGAKVYTWNWDGSENGTLTQDEYDGIKEADIVYVAMTGGIPTQATMNKDGDYRRIIISQFVPQENGTIIVVSLDVEINEDKSYNSNTSFAVIPTKTSQLENDSNFITSEDVAAVALSGSYNDLQDTPTIPAAVTESTVSGWGFTKNAGTYSKPSTGIPKSDLASAVQTSLGKADTALQSYTEQYKGTVTGVKINGTTKNPSSGVVDLGTVITAHQTLKTINGTSILGSGDITISGGNSDANVSAVDTGDAIDDVTVNYATKIYVDGLVGDINSILESIINGGGGVSLITFTIDGTQYQAEEGMTWEQWINSVYNTDSNFINPNGYITKATSSTKVVYDGFNNRNVVISDIIRANYGYTMSSMSTEPT